MRREIPICLLLALATISVYWAVHAHEFVNYDDGLYVTENPRVQAGLSREGIEWAFGRLTSEERTYWHPITWLSHMLDCQLFGMNSGAHHLVNLLFHTLNVLLLFLFLNRATGCSARSALVAGLFALHPLQVDTVAWIAERKNVLSTFFWLLTFLAYVRYARRPGISHYLPVFILFALGLMAKPMLVTLPGTLLLLDYWPLGRLAGLRFGPAVNAGICGADEKSHMRFPSVSVRWLIIEKLPLLLLAGIAGTLTIMAHQRLKLMITMAQFPIESRINVSLRAYVDYLAKFVWPTNLAVFYPLKPDLPVIQTTGCALLIGIISMLALQSAKRRPWFMAGWFWFLGTLVPVIGLLQVSFQAMADRWAYVPIIGFLIMIVWGVSDLLVRWRWGRMVAGALAIASVITCSVATYIQLGYWRDSETLFRHALKVTKENYVAHLNLGSALAAQGKLTEADEQFQEVLKAMPRSPYGHHQHAGILARQGKLEEALAEFREALKFDPNDEQTHFNFGNALAICKNYDEAKEQFEATLRLNPDHAGAENNLGNTLVLQGKRDDAVIHFERAVKLDQNMFEAHYFLAGALARQNDFDGAINHFRAALKIKKDYPSALNDLAWIFATEDAPKIHDPAQAVQLSHHACELTGFEDPGYLDTLAAAYSEAGRFPEAVETARQAAAAARKTGEEKLAEKIESRLKFYEQHIAYRAMMKSLAAGPRKS